MNETTHLGDGLYARFDGYQVYLMANSHVNPTDQVALDPYVLRAFLAWVTKLNEETEEENDG